jgi:hypothetical protein
MEKINIDTLLATIQEIVRSQQEDRLQRDQDYQKQQERYQRDYQKQQEKQAINEAEMLFIREQFQEAKKLVKNLSKNIGNIGERFGSFTEGLAYPSMRKVLYKQYGIDNTIANFLKRFPDGTEVELDAFGYTNGTINNAVVVEIKTYLRSDHIKNFRDRLQQFKHQFPEFADKHLYGIFATPCIVSKELREQVYNAGLQLAVVHDEIFDFKPNPKAVDFNEI